MCGARTKPTNSHNITNNYLQHGILHVVKSWK
jgi:hypothetical protein